MHEFSFLKTFIIYLKLIENNHSQKMKVNFLTAKGKQHAGSLHIHNSLCHYIKKKNKTLLQPKMIKIKQKQARRHASRYDG